MSKFYYLLTLPKAKNSSASKNSPSKKPVIKSLPKEIKENLLLKPHAHATPTRNKLLSAQRSKRGTPLGKLIENPSIATPSSAKNLVATRRNKESNRKVKVVCAFCKGKKLTKIIQQQLYNKYEASTQNTYNLNMVNDIMLDIKTELAANFKEHLIYNDSTEFLRLFNSRPQSQLEELANYYHAASKVFPNFISLEEKKFMFKNISRKQKAINRRLVHLAQTGSELSENRLFNSRFLSEIAMRCSRTMVGEGERLEEVLDKFIYRDSLSIIHKSRCENMKTTFCTGKSPQKKPVVMAKNFLGASKDKAKGKQSLKRYASQKEIVKSIRLSSQHASAIRSSRKNHNSVQSLKQKPGKAAAKSPLASARLTLSDSDPLQISISLNLVLDKAKLRSGTPSVCAAAVRDVLGAYQVQAKAGLKKGNLGGKREGLSKKELVVFGNVTAIRSEDGEKFVVGKAKGKKGKGRGSVKPQQRRNIAINHLCKSIKNLLLPIGSSNSKPTLKRSGKSGKIYSPRSTKITKYVHRRSGTDIVQSGARHTSAIEQGKGLLPV